MAELLRPFTAEAELSREALTQLRLYLDLLLRWNARVNLTAVRDAEEIVQRHFGESLFAARVLNLRNRETTTLADVGSGAGFPGIPIKVWAPHIGLTLIESQNKKATFLREVLRTLKLENAQVFCGRAEQWGQTADRVTLRGWLVRPVVRNENVVIVLHGLGDNRLGMTGYAQLLLAHGYTVLLPDARAHGASGGTLATYGLLEREDIHRWVDFLRAAEKPQCIYGMAESMGAAQLLQSLQAGTQLCAVVAESSFSTFREIAYDRMGQPFGAGPWVGRILLRPLVEIAFLRARWKYGLAMWQISPAAAAAGSRIPILLIHGQIDSNIPVRHSRAIHAASPRTVLWEVQGADHCGALAVAPAEFENRVLGWFRSGTASSTEVH